VNRVLPASIAAVLSAQFSDFGKADLYRDITAEHFNLDRGCLFVKIDLLNLTDGIFPDSRDNSDGIADFEVHCDVV
jgi:hypothetical protein